MKKIRDRLWEKAALKRIPLTVAFELLPVCNLSCKMCYVRKSMNEVNKAGGLIPGKQWLVWAKEAAEAGLLFPLLTGGEPFLHPDFWEIYEGMAKMGMQISINSNGTLITKEIAERLSKQPPTRINITLYGASEESYQNLCGNKEAFHKVREAVKWLKEYKIPVKFNCSITSYNVNDMEAIIAYAKEQELPLQLTTYMFPPLRRDAALVGENDRLTPEEAAHARVKADFLQAEPEWFIGQARRYSRFVPLDQIEEKEHLPLKIRCRAGTSSGWLSWQGKLTNCGMYNSVSVDMKNHTFKEAWHEVTNMTQELTYRSFCSICPNQWLCHACIAMVHNESGSINGKPEYMCKMNEAASRYYQEYAARIEDKLNTDINEIDYDIPCGVDEF